MTVRVFPQDSERLGMDSQNQLSIPVFSRSNGQPMKAIHFSVLQMAGQRLHTSFSDIKWPASEKHSLFEP
jgi:hypothetical protein